MTALVAVSAGVKDMADGSLRITFEFDPRFAADAYALFGARGRNVAIAALKDGVPIPAQPEPEKAELREHIGALGKWCVMRCGEADFRLWLNETFEAENAEKVETAHEAGDLIKFLLNIGSRKEIDQTPELTEKFKAEILRPYQKWLIARGGA
jgi:hypothetical protein